MREERAIEKWREVGSAVCVWNLQSCTFRVYFQVFEEVIERFRRSTKGSEERMAFGLPTVTSYSVAKGIDRNSAVFRPISDVYLFKSEKNAR